ncbi:hypothetical protein [uncultured Victivallis sp.]|uniref:hypothetical protein n=1 Tax=uncultured Victivallis sp. TaxID=354118 RepID=UPI0025831074|nr:hypothetical protein [uncultured Victivallis sp.]
MWWHHHACAFRISPPDGRPGLSDNFFVTASLYHISSRKARNFSNVLALYAKIFIFSGFLPDFIRKPKPRFSRRPGRIGQESRRRPEQQQKRRPPTKDGRPGKGADLTHIFMIVRALRIVNKVFNDQPTKDE